MRPIFGIIVGLFALMGCNPKPVPEPSRPVPTSCAKAEFEKLLWLPESALLDVQLPPHTRVIYPDTAVTMDFRQNRLNIFIGKSGRIERVYCG